MNIILLSGGSGKRLWPLSNEIRSKQFLKVVKTENGRVVSMLHRVYNQIKSVIQDANITVTTSKIQEDSIRSQLGGKVSVVLEPERRDTFPAVMLSCANLALEQGIGLDECITVLPVDPYVDLGYFDTVNSMKKFICGGTFDIILMGVKPTYPSEKYGYLKTEPTGRSCEKVIAFKEKPSLYEAEKLVDLGALWNCGVFAFRLGYALEILKKYIAFNSYEDVLHQYNKLKKISFDYEVVEKANNVGAVTYDGEWKDIGTWNTLTEVMGELQLGEVITDGKCENTHIINELEIPIIAMGMKNTVIAVSPDGILVADKEQSSYLKKYAEEIDQRPMFEEKEWGEYKVVDMSINENGMKSLTKRKIIKAGGCIPCQLHRNRSEVIVILNGRCKMMIDGIEKEAEIGESFSIGEGIKHEIIAISSVELIEIQVGLDLWEDGTEIIQE